MAFTDLATEKSPLASSPPSLEFTFQCQAKCFGTYRSVHSGFVNVREGWEFVL